MSQAAYQQYARTDVPPPTDNGATDVVAIRNWLSNELGVVARAIPRRTTKTVTAHYTLSVQDDVVLVDTSGGAVTITFPDPTRVQHGTWTVKRITATANAVTFASIIASTGAAATFDGATSPTLAAQWNTKVVRSDGNQYYILASF